VLHPTWLRRHAGLLTVDAACTRARHRAVCMPSVPAASGAQAGAVRACHAATGMTRPFVRMAIPDAQALMGFHRAGVRCGDRRPLVGSVAARGAATDST